MKLAMAKHLTRLVGIGFAGRAAVLTSVLFGAWVAIGSLAFFLTGQSGLSAATLAAGLCWFPAVLALLVAGHLTGRPLTRLLAAMGLRMALPLMVGVIVVLHGGPLVRAGFLNYLVIFYLLTLTVETALILSCPRIGPPRLLPTDATRPGSK
jgi:hypothetical protein